METKIKSNSLVIVANVHNPSVIGAKFLIESKILKDINELKKDSVLITPQFSQIVLKDDTSIQIDQGRLAINSTFSNRPYVIGKKYCESFKYVSGSAIGINFDVELSEYNLDEWFEEKEPSKDFKCYEIKFKFDNCNITVKRSAEQNTAQLNFNFHYDIKGEIGDLDLDFEKEWEANSASIKEMVSKIF
jgi:hypothetical protein